MNSNDSCSSSLVLRDDRIIKTVEKLQQRIGDRFPDSGLSQLCGELLEVARQASQRSGSIGQPIQPIRLMSFLLALTFVIVLVIVAAEMVWLVGLDTSGLEFTDFIQTFDAGISASIFVAAGLFYFASLEKRTKRGRALKAIHELRSIAHVIDMHQLTKDPERLLPTWKDASHSPKTRMTPFELNRYLDYCSEMLSLTGKIAALYITHFDDPVAVAAASEIEQLSTGLSRKIWQKIIATQAIVAFAQGAAGKTMQHATPTADRPIAAAESPDGST